MTTGVIIPTLNGERELPPLLRVLLHEPELDTILVVDSCSADATVSTALSFKGVRVVSIPRNEFNHGATREFGRRQVGTDIVVFLTQDVVPERGFLGNLIAPIVRREAAVSYSRQIPHLGAGFLESFPREFNYPEEGNIRDLGDTTRCGVYTFFCSDSCAAYENAALEEIGGFAPTLTNEDYFAVAKLLVAGKKICYAANSRVRHSHRYTLGDEFRRYFDTGYVRAECPWVNELVGQAEGRGAEFARSMFRRILSEAPLLLPYAIIQTGVKWAGFRAGFAAKRLNLPARWCRRLSSQRYYWTSKYHAANSKDYVSIPPAAEQEGS